jgi:hypothetical protein
MDKSMGFEVNRKRTVACLTRAGRQSRDRGPVRTDLIVAGQKAQAPCLLVIGWRGGMFR